MPELAWTAEQWGALGGAVLFFGILVGLIYSLARPGADSVQGGDET
ncbi:MAG: hypothetical protein KDB53_16535 [Planctomycetes bacterium]|nr:hypothetical protein [Planctomycetota bacterium]